MKLCISVSFIKGLLVNRSLPGLLPDLAIEVEVSFIPVGALTTWQPKNVNRLQGNRIDQDQNVSLIQGFTSGFNTHYSWESNQYSEW